MGRRIRSADLPPSPRSGRVIIMVALIAFVYLAVGVLFPQGRNAYLARHVVYLLAPFLAGGAAMRTALRAREGERVLWWGIVAGCAMIASALTITTPSVFTGDLPLWPAVPAVLTLLGPAVLTVAVFLLSRFRVSGSRAQLRHALEALSAGVVVFASVFGLAILPLDAAYGPLPASALVMAACYPVVGVALIVGTAVNHIDSRVNRRPAWERILASGLGLAGVTLVLFPLWFIAAGFDPTSPWDYIVQLVAVCSMYLLFEAALERAACCQCDRAMGGAAYVPTGRGIRAQAFPTAFTLAPAVFAWLAMTAERSSVNAWVYGACGIVSAVLVLARAVLVAIESGQLLRRAVADPLTGLLGNRYFHERLQVETELAHRRQERLSVAVIDIDDFSCINSVHGHSRGDAVLRDVARMLERACRAQDAVCRLGGDEFGVILVDTDVEDALAACRRLQESLRQVEAGDAAVTASVGIACFPRHGATREEVFAKADGAQYWAKYHGKDSIVVYDAAVVDALSAEDRIRDLESRSHLSTVRALAAAVDARDPLTQYHSRNVAVLAILLAREMKLGDDRTALIEVAAVLHDIGKIGVSDAVLRKPGVLTASERSHVQEHPVLGTRILESTHLHEILPWVRHHHERWDGAGYPDGLAGEEIPFEARLLAVCDAYDAMTSDRPYRSAMSPAAALQELDLCIGTQFDPRLAEAFIRMVSASTLLSGGRPMVGRMADGSFMAEMN